MTDQAEPIPEDERSRIFQRFYRGQNSKTAEIQIDYSRKRVEKAKVIRNVEEFTDNKPVFIKIQDAKWSIGSVGSTTETQRVEVGYKGDPISTLLGPIQEPNSSGYIAYLGGTYSSAAGLRRARAEKFNAYLKECISDDNPTCFQKSHLKEIGTYSYTHFGTRNSRTNFINNYRAAAERGNGFYVKVTVADEVIYNKVINFSNGANRLDSLTIDQGLPQGERLVKLNQIAIQQMKVLEDNQDRNLLQRFR